MNKQTEINPAFRAQERSPALLHEMMRSFTVLARTLNLSQAVEELNSTRQTVRRHIAQLEAARGVKLFDIQARRYTLTEAGAHALEPACALIERGEAWYNGDFTYIGGMNQFCFDEAEGWGYYQQQQPIDRIWEGASELLKAALADWGQSRAELEHPMMQAIRPYIIVYRDSLESWICTEIGERSFYSSWYGWAQARSSIGRPLDQFPGGERFSSLINIPFADIQNSRGIRLDQVALFMPPDATGHRELLAFERLLMGVRLPDGSPALISVVDRPSELRISGLDPAILETMARSAAIEFTS